MSLFFETIKIENGKAFNIKYHNIRLNKTIQDIYKISSNIDIYDYINPPHDKVYRCKLFYDKEIKDIQYIAYQKRVLDTFKVIESDIEYPYKSTDRSQIDSLLTHENEADDIIIIKNGFIRDTSIANIAIFDGFKWLTPKNPLLKGTMRANLLKKGFLFEDELSINDIKKAEKFAIMNALIGFYEVKNVKILF